MTNRSTGGFSLLEILVSATIIAVLTVIGVVSYSSVNKRSRDVKRKSDLEQIRSALEMFRTDNTEYPNVGSGMRDAAGLQSSLVPAYMPKIPDDSNPDNNYYYEAILTGSAYSSYCICAQLETIASGQSDSTCTISLPANCNYGLKNP